MATSKRNLADSYTLRARKEGYPARSIYKLEEIQDKFKIMKSNSRVLDVGASPGSWTLYLHRNIVGKNGSIVAIDLNPLGLEQIPSNVFFIQGDAFSKENREKLVDLGPYDTIVSDAAPMTTGNRSVDTSRSEWLCEQVFYLALEQLKLGGNLVVKIFQGGGSQTLMKEMRNYFEKVRAFKPKACRKDSFETYMICFNKQKDLVLD